VLVCLARSLTNDSDVNRGSMTCDVYIMTMHLVKSSRLHCLSLLKCANCLQASVAACIAVIHVILDSFIHV
jgi:hypothetical protein